MCVCRPEVRTPFCGRPGCTWPGRDAAAQDAPPQAVSAPEIDPERVRARCPACGELLLSNTYYAEGRGYLILWECAASLIEAPTCDYRRVL